MSQDVYILSGVRTALGAMLGTLASVPTVTLGATVILEALKRANIPPEAVDQLIMGCVLPAGLGQAPARQAGLKAGLSESVSCTTINKVCGSGLKSIMLAASMIKAGDAKVVIAGGMENMTKAPHLLMDSREGYRFGSKEVKDSMQWDGLFDPYDSVTMGELAETAVRKYGFTKEDQEEFAKESITKAQTAHAQNIFANEIVPVVLKTRKGEEIVLADEGIIRADVTKISGQRPAFTKDGTITAGCSSTINDGASACVVAGAEYSQQAKFKIVAYGEFSGSPKEFTLAPIGAIHAALKRANMQVGDIDLFEINEAFACVTMAAIKELSIPKERVNIYGGAVALGHPIGASGSRILVTLMNGLERENKRYGLATLCIGGGEAVAMIIEKIR